MVIDDLDVESLATFKTETHPPLIVDANAPLIFSVAFQRFQPILWRDSQVLEAPRDVELSKLSERHTFNIGKSGNSLASE